MKSNKALGDSKILIFFTICNISALNSKHVFAMKTNVTELNPKQIQREQHLKLAEEKKEKIKKTEQGLRDIMAREEVETINAFKKQLYETNTQKPIYYTIKQLQNPNEYQIEFDFSKKQDKTLSNNLMGKFLKDLKDISQNNNEILIKNLTFKDVTNIPELSCLNDFTSSYFIENLIIESDDDIVIGCNAFLNAKIKYLFIHSNKSITINNNAFFLVEGLEILNINATSNITLFKQCFGYCCEFKEINVECAHEIYLDDFAFGLVRYDFKKKVFKSSKLIISVNAFMCPSSCGKLLYILGQICFSVITGSNFFHSFFSKENGFLWINLETFGTVAQ